MRWRQKGWTEPSVSLSLSVLLFLLTLPEQHSAHLTFGQAKNELYLNKCPQSCNFSLVETIPIGMIYKNSSTPHLTTYNIWREMIAKAKHTIEIASFYWTLNADKKFPGSQKGKAIFDDLVKAGLRQKVKVKIIQSEPSKSIPDNDTQILTRLGAATVRNLNLQRLVGGGILHTKLWIVDRTSVYLGSANTDWRSLTHVKELGLFVKNCTCLVDDIAKIFDVYWKMGLPTSKIPKHWPRKLFTNFNKKSPLVIKLNNTRTSVYVSSSPPQLNPKGRENDIDSILSVIHGAEQFVYIAVMDFLPLMIYTSKPQFWPIIDNALREAAINRNIKVKLLISKWKQTRKSEMFFLRSLTAISKSYSNVELLVKVFVVPSTQKQEEIPFARVNHNKYMVTDNNAYIGTSNWAGDYFTTTAGIGVVVESGSHIRSELENIFLRDWNSDFATALQ